MKKESIQRLLLLEHKPEETAAFEHVSVGICSEHGEWKNPEENCCPHCEFDD